MLVKLDKKLILTLGKDCFEKKIKHTRKVFNTLQKTTTYELNFKCKILCYNTNIKPTLCFIQKEIFTCIYYYIFKFVVRTLNDC